MANYLNNPLFQMGAGILANPGPGQIGRGIQSGLFGLQRQRQLEAAAQQRELANQQWQQQFDAQQAHRAAQMAQQQRQAPLSFSQFQGMTPEQQAQYGRFKSVGHKAQGMPKDVMSALWYMNASPEERKAFDQTKRQQQFLNLQNRFFNPRTQQSVDVGMKPVDEPEHKSKVKVAEAIGKAHGEAEVSLKDVEAMQPRLENLVNELSALGEEATYTQAGQFADATRRQLGMPVGPGAVARKEYISKVDNEILPLLRQTFGAQFTEREGQSLKATLGDPNASPEEKDAVLRSFIKTKREQIRTKQKRAGAAPVTADPLGIR